MHIKAIFFFTCLSIVAFAAITPVHATENITYNQDISKSSALHIARYIRDVDRAPEQYDIAKVDLNNDNLFEFILKDRACEDTEKLCSFDVLAETERGVVSIGQIEASSVALSEHKSNGVRDILAYNNTLNDYDYGLYVWVSGQSRYILSTDTAKGF